MMRVGIIGFGGAGQAHSFYWSCVAGCRVDEDLRSEAGGRRARRGARASATFCIADTTVLADLDAVVVCTPDATHAALHRRRRSRTDSTCSSRSR